MPFDENAPLLEGLVRPGAPRRPAKSSKQRGSILSNVHANRVTVFEEHQTAKAEGLETQMGGEKIRDDRIQNLETAVKVLQKKGERTAIDQKTLSDRLSTTEANFVELKCELMLFSKPSPSTPAKSRVTYDPSTDSPIICPSITGAEENTSFASPPVPALQRKLLRMSMQGKGPSGLRSELHFDDFENESTILDNDSMEYLTEDHSPGGHREGSLSWEDLGPTSLESIVFNRKSRNPAPTFDPDVSLGDVSMIEGIYDDAARAGAYLDSQQTGTSDITPAVLSEVNSDDHDVEDLISSATIQTESLAQHNDEAGVEPVEAAPPMVDASIQTEIATEVACDATGSVSTMIDATVQTETESIVTNDIGVQVYQPAVLMKDAAIQTHYEDPTVERGFIIQDLSARVKQLECLIEAQSRSSSSVEHEALVEAYKRLLRVEAEKRLDLVAMISNFKDEVASCQMEQPQKSVYGISGIWSAALSHAVIAFVAYAVVRKVNV